MKEFTQNQTSSDSKSYQGGLNDLLSHSTQARSIFIALPEGIQGSLTQNSTSIHSVQDLCSCVNSAIANDK